MSFVTNIGSSFNPSRPIPWQRRAKSLSFPPAISTPFPSPAIKPWYGTMLGCADPILGGTFPVAK